MLRSLLCISTELTTIATTKGLPLDDTPVAGPSTIAYSQDLPAVPYEASIYGRRAPVAIQRSTDDAASRPLIETSVRSRRSRKPYERQQRTAVSTIAHAGASAVVPSRSSSSHNLQAEYAAAETVSTSWNHAS